MPSVVLGLAVIRTDKFLPDEPSFEAAGPAFFNFMDDILEIPSRPGVSRNFEFEEAETDFIFGAVHPIEHQDEAHSMSGAPVVEGLGKAWIIIAPEIEFEIVVRVILQRARSQAVISATLVIVPMTRRRVGADPLLPGIRSRHTSKMNGNFLHVIHVI